MEVFFEIITRNNIWRKTMVMAKRVTASGEMEIVETTGQTKPEGGPMIVKTGEAGKNIKENDEIIRNGIKWIVIAVFETDNTKMVRLISCQTGDEEIMMLQSLLNEIRG